MRLAHRRSFRAESSRNETKDMRKLAEIKYETWPSIFIQN